MSCLDSYFGEVPDPRVANASHRLSDLIVMMIAASLGGASSATEFSLFAQERRQVLSRLIDYDAAPSHGTFSRLLRLMDLDAFGRAFAAFAAAFAQARQEIVALDGKALRRAYETGLAAAPPLTVSAFASRTRLCLAAATPTANENEIEAALKVVELIDITDQLVTADAPHCHKRMATAIIDGGGNYLLALKKNRPAWYKRANERLATERPDHAECEKTSHGRHEWRRAEVVAADEALMDGHKAFVRITSRRGEAQAKIRLFMASAILPAQQALDVAPLHTICGG